MANTGQSLTSDRGGGEPCLGHAPWESELVHRHESVKQNRKSRTENLFIVHRVW